MKLYLSSYKLGNKVDELKNMIKGKIALISNALDSLDKEIFDESTKNNLNLLIDEGFDVEILDLKDYFGKSNLLKEKLKEFSAVFVRGGNCFILRKAMKYSGFDKIIKDMSDDFVYSGYSAGICVLAPSLKGIDLMDAPEINPYDKSEPIWEGLEIIDYLIVPHYNSNHRESEDANKVVDYLKKNNIKFKTLQDGEVIIE